MAGERVYSGGETAMSLYVGIPLLLSLAFLQSSVLPRIPILTVVPNLTLLTIVAWSFQRGPNEGMVWAMIGGLAIDLATGAPLGISPPPLMVAALVVGIARGSVFRRNILLPALISLLAIGLYQIIHLALFKAVGLSVSWRTGIEEAAIPSTVVHLALMPIVYLSVSWLARLVHGSQIRLGR
jgi:rod shape-determining protein MreD